MKSHPLGKIAHHLSQAAQRKSLLSPLVFMTDPKRIKDLPAQIACLPKGCAVIYRHFGDPQRTTIAGLLRQYTKSNGQQLLIGGGDIELANNIEADGVHFRRSANLHGPIIYRKTHRKKIITMAGLKTGHYHNELSCLDGLLISSIFPSQSPSSGPPIGTKALAKLCQTLDVPIFALGGITPKTAPQLLGTGVYGLAAIDGFKF